MATKFKIIEEAKRQARMCFLGIAIPCDKKTVDGDMIRSEKVLKFNRKALRKAGKISIEKVDPRYNGGDDTMVVKIGKPGSRERVDALAHQYEAIQACGEDVSPFYWKGE